MSGCLYCTKDEGRTCNLCQRESCSFEPTSNELGKKPTCEFCYWVIEEKEHHKLLSSGSE